MSEACLTSVIVNNYNYGRFLPDAIESALNQTYHCTEVLVVDDGSTDASREILARYGSAVIPVLKQNGGQGSAFNAGFAVSRGDVILYLDADDMLLPTAVARAVERFDDPDVVKVHWPLRLIDEQGRETGGTGPGGRLPQGDLREKAFRLGPTNYLSPPTSGNAWSRPLLQRILPVPDLFKTGADTYLFELAPFFGVVRTISEPQSLYRLHGRNFHSLMSIDYKINRQLTYYSSCCAELRARCGAAQVDEEEWKRHSWWHRLDLAVKEIATLPGPGDPLILVDDGVWEVGPIAGRPRIPFLERHGHYWGRPADDAAAISELRRLQRSGAKLIGFAWPAFWWLEQYADFHRYLLERFPCILDNDRLRVFDLYPGEGLTEGGDSA
jgi:glycosyltransferase involved in cell wall biosynthesis